jgi:TRAP-type C4-dicarboxylate transport system permease small subunit
MFFVGSAGLLAVMLVEAVAVIGRHAGLPVLGALELVQTAIVPAACAAMLIATLRGAHAAVHMLTDRMPQAWRERTERLGALLAALFFGALTAGAVWLAADYWHGFEHSEVLHIPFRPLRMLVAASALSLTALFLYRAIRPQARP